MELTVDQALQQGVAAHKEGKLEEAERLYRAILQSQPLHPDANHNLGILAVSVNKADAALPLFKTALEANPRIEQFWLSYIDALAKLDNVADARVAFDQAKDNGITGEAFDQLEQSINAIKVTADTKVPSQAQVNTLLEHYQNGRFSDAERLALSITKRSPKHQFAWKVLGAIFGQIGRNSEALNAGQTAVALSPEDAEAHSNLGAMLKELNRFDEAEASLMQAIALKPDYAEAHGNLGITLNELGRLNEAEASLRQAVVLKPDFAEAHNNLGITLQELGRLDEAEASYSIEI
jgi:Flp pilus assembly protein TadD